jgi:acetoin utilization deacetylase AcuC-like enzyme
LSPGSEKAAFLAVGAVCDAVDKVLAGEADNAFCAIRPPGHHAEPDLAMGFCLFNNVAIAANYARRHYNIERIAIVDFDVHHGNGTQAVFYNQPNVLYASTHEMPNYPGTGYPNETGVGNIINVPLAAGDTGVEFRKKYNTIIFPALRKFKPELLIISAGFDAHKYDPLSSIKLVEEDFRWLTQELMDIADSNCKGRVISALEGGYNLNALAASVAIHVLTLMGRL